MRVSVLAVCLLAGGALVSGSPMLRAVQKKMKLPINKLGWSAPGHEIIAAAATQAGRTDEWCYCLIKANLLYFTLSMHG